jgi:pimeloyl-ACP methyl ester carboxylesterase
MLLLTVVLTQEAKAQSTANVSPPGRLVDIGGYRLHLRCGGSGGPTVILIAGAGGFSFDWSLVQPRVSAQARVCSYDRAGLAWSDVGPVPRTMRQDAYELQRLLQAAREKPPYVLVGHSIGALIARVYVMEYPGEVAGMVFVDATHEDTTLMYQGKIGRVRDGSKGRSIPPPQTMNSSPPRPPTDDDLKEFEMNRQRFALPKNSPPFDRLASEAQAWRLWALSTARVVAREDDLWADELDALARARSAVKTPLADRPLIVLIAGGSGKPPANDDEKRLAEQKRSLKLTFVDLSSRGRTVIIEHSGHHIHLDAPEAVVDAVREVLDTVRSESAPER